MSIFPMIQPSQESAAATLPLCKEVAWDFEKHVPIWQRGEPKIVTGAEAVKVWVYKALLTPRFKYEIYTWAYGSEFESLIGQAYTPDLKQSECTRYLRECLLINPYITSVTNIETAFDAGTLSISCKVHTIYGEVLISAVI